MNKLQKSLLILLALLAFGQTAWAQQQFSGGSGTEASPYLIASDTDWNKLAYNINNFCENYSGKYFQLTNNITITETVSTGPSTTMLGVSETASFQGIFDGNGKTITVNYTDNSSENYCAPFRFISGATIKNLHITGTITTTGMRPASIASFVVENSTITSCWSEVAISSSRSSDIDAGGLVARVNNGKTLTLTDCLFSGSINYSNSSGYEGGGMVGYT